jgi:O-antigen/teichoic acid export membrane protein
MAVLRFAEHYQQKIGEKFQRIVTRNYLFSTGVAALFFALFGALFSNVFNHSLSLWILSAFLLIFQSYFLLVQERLRVQLKPTPFGLLLLVKNFLYISLGFLFLKIGLSSQGLVLAMLASFLFPVLFVLMKEKMSVHFGKINFEDQKVMFLYAFPLIGTLLLNSIISLSDRYFITYILGINYAGAYSATYDLTQQILAVFMTIIGMSAYPLMIKAKEQGSTKEEKKILSDNIVFFLMINIPVLLILIFAADDFVTLFLGAPFRLSAIELLPILSMGIFFSGVRSYYLDLSFQIEKQTKYQVYIMLSAALLNIILNFLFISQKGIIGAAYSTLLSYFFAMILSYLFSRKIKKMPFPIKKIFNLITMILPAAAIIFVKFPFNNTINFFLKIFVFSFIYILVIYIVNFMQIRTKLNNLLKGYF